MWRRAVDPNKVREAFEQVPRDSPIVDGILMEDVLVPLLFWNMVPHTLGRVPKGVIVLYASLSSGFADYCVYRSRHNNPTLQPTSTHFWMYVGNITYPLYVDLWVF